MAISAARRETQNQLSNIEQDFSTWASNYIKDRDLKKLTLERQKLEARGTEIELSKQYRPIFQHVIDGIRAAISAYNAKTGSDFNVQLNDLPSNLYAVDPSSLTLGTVVFSPNVKWTVGFYSERPATASRLPYFEINIVSGQSTSQDQLRIYINPPNLTLTAWGGGVATAARLSTDYPINSASESVRTIVQQLIETQISSLPNQ